jgi:hypothetical protein
MELTGDQIDPLTRLPVVIVGSWHQSASKWNGTAEASEPLVSIVFLTARGETEWCKSERGRPEALELSIALFPFEDRTTVQVNAMAGGGGRRLATRLPSPGYRPVLQPQLRTTTGRVFSLTSVEGEPLVSLSILLLAARDVAVGRHGLWQLRKPLADRTDEPLRTILTRGRTGQFRVA